MEGSSKQGGAGKKRDDNIIQVSSKRNANFYVYLAKKILAENHPDIELHALGNAVSTGVIAAENLVRNNYATFVSIQTHTNIMENGSKKAKLVVKLRKHEQFDENIEKFNKINEENKSLAEKEKATVGEK